LIFCYNGQNLYSISKLAAALINTRFEKYCSIFSLKQNDLPNYLNSRAANKFSIIAFSFNTPAFIETIPLLEKLKNIKNKIVIAGGPHITALSIANFKFGIDVIFLGESEQTLHFFLEDFFDNPKKIKEIYKTNEIINLDNYPPFAYNLGVITPIEIMRGCINNCAYCQTPKLFKTVRFRSISSILPYLQYFLKTNRSFINFMAPIGNYYQRGDLIALEDLFKQTIQTTGLKICFGHFPSELYPTLVSEKFIGLINKYCSNKKIAIGFQSAAPEILTLMRRNYISEQLIDILKICNNYSIIPIIDFMFGMPTETKTQRKETQYLIDNIIKKYRVLIHPHIFMPLPDTDLWLSEPAKLDAEFIEYLESLAKLSEIKFNWKQHLLQQNQIIKFREKILFK